MLRLGVFASSFPSWFFAGIGSHFEVCWVVCLDNPSHRQFSSLLQSWSTPVHLLCGALSLPGVDILAINDGMAGALLRHIMTRPNVASLIITDFKVRSFPPDYYHCYHTLRHGACGGVSNATARFSFFSPSRLLIEELKSFEFPTYPFATLSSILTRTLVGRRTGYVPPKSSPCRDAPQLLKGLKNVYSAKGLFPMHTTSPPRILAPCVYPSTPWTIRHLSPSELGHVFDLPVSVLAQLSDAELLQLLDRLRYPLKCHSVLLQHLFYYRWPSASGLSSDLPQSNDSCGSASGAPHLDCIAVASAKDPPSLPGGGTSLVVVVEDGNVGTQLESENVDDVNLSTDDAYVGSTAAPPLLVTEEERKAVAVKSDDAPVPVHVWRTQLERILGLSIPPDTYESGADRFRDKLLRMWRRGLFRDFLIWVKCHHKDELGPELAWCTGQFSWPCRGKPLKVGDGTGGGIVHWDTHHSRYVWFRSRKARLANIGKRRYKECWLKRVLVLGKSRLAVQECLEKAAQCTWWKWDNGSRLFFWRWPPQYMEEARDGCRCWYLPNSLPNYKVPQSNPSNPDMKDKIIEKLADVLRKLYMDRRGEIRSLTSFFDVMKGLFDIRMVYNGTSCGLNAACWAPWFPLPTVRTHLRTVEAESWLADIDMGEMFLNFLLDERLRPYAGVDLTLYFPEMLSDLKTTDWARWTRLLMGFCASPYFATRCVLRSRRILLGSKDDASNPFQWDHAVKNYPGLSSYNPLRPTVYKVRKDGKLASDLHKYIDDLRSTSFSEKAIWEASMRVMTKINWLGMQNAARKYREGSKRQGAWAGSIIFTPSEVTVSVSQARWDKMKGIIKGLLEICEMKGGIFPMKGLLSDRGVLTYVSQTYTAMVPYLKGMHLTVDSWRPGRDEEGWKMKIEARIRGVFANRPEVSQASNEDLDTELARVNEVVEEEMAAKFSKLDQVSVVAVPPTSVRGVPRLQDDLKALEKMFSGETPAVRFVRAKSADMVKFGFGDASGDGYGSGLAKLRGRPNIRYGKWGLFYGSEHTSSNFRELRNIVDAIELDYRRGLLDGFELFFFTDNEVAEKAYYKGTSSSKTLFDLVLRLRLIEMEGRMIIHVIHVSGKRMIRCGIDGLSRGDTGDGIAAGVDMKSFIPLHLDVKERSPGVMDWVSSWWPERELGGLTALELDDWFIQDERHTNVLWTPAPAGGESCVEEMANWIHHSPDERVHVIMIPTVWTCKWRHLGGPRVTPSWRNWCGSCGKCGRTLKDPIAEIFCANFSSRRGRFDACHSAWCSGCYIELDGLEFPRSIPVDEEGVQLPGDDNLYRSARPGDTLMVPFQCDLCHFRNIKGRNPFVDNNRDKLALTMVRRANLDSFWSRTSATVKSNLQDFRQQIKHSVKLWGGTPSLPPRGPFPLEDSFGMAIATATLSRSLDKGRNAEHVQFSTSRRIRSSFSNYWNASLMTLSTGVMQEGQAKLMTTECPVYHYWYTRMMKGMHERVGDLVCQDQAVSRELMEALMERFEKKLVSDVPNRDRWIEVGTFAMMLWLGALRGNEAMMSSLDGCIRMMKESENAQTPENGFGILVLQGKFKASTGKTRYLLYFSSQTRSRFKTCFREWLTRLIEVRSRQGRDSGWLFARGDGSQLEMSHYEVDILQTIADVQAETDGIIPKDLDVFDKYGVFRSFRRGATSVIRNEGKVSREDIELNNWWRKMEDSRGKHVSGDMLSYYTEDLLVIDAKKRFSEAL